jgi:hypothetical protein
MLVCMRDVENAHFLHAPRGVEAVVRVPIEGAQALDWIPGKEELVVACKAVRAKDAAPSTDGAPAGGGTLALVDPVMGTRMLAHDLEDPGALSVNPEGDKVAILERGRGVSVRDLARGRVVWTVPFSLVADLWVGWWKGGVVAAGEDLDGRTVTVLDHDGNLRARGRLPKGAAVGVSKSGKLVLGRVTARGAEVVPLDAPLRNDPPTRHRLRFSSSGVLFGVAEGGVAVWNPAGATITATTVRCYGVSSATLDATGAWLAIGTRDGGVAVTGIGAGLVDRNHPDPQGGHNAPVLDIAFAKRGRWLATAGLRCWIWSW